jgi:hypothetical protein
VVVAVAAQKSTPNQTTAAATSGIASSSGERFPVTVR